jgi:hypothetical protein
VALWITTSAPCSSGRKFTALANVESTTSATPASRVSALSGRRSSTRVVGFTGLSTNSARVLGRRRRRQPRVCAGSTNVVSMPSCASSRANRACEPP